MYVFPTHLPQGLANLKALREHILSEHALTAQHARTMSMCGNVYFKMATSYSVQVKEIIPNPVRLTHMTPESLPFTRRMNSWPL